MSLPLASLNSESVYLDTNSIYLLLRAITPEIADLFRGIEGGQIGAYTSVLTFDELAYRLLLALIRDTYGASPLDRLRQNQRQMINEFSLSVDSLLKRVLEYRNLTVVDLGPADLIAMRRNVQQYALLPRDALHLAAMQKANCFHLVSQDNDFDHIPAITRYTLA